MSKRLAIVMCNYNKAEYAVKCIRSAFDSTYKAFDFYAVDNASTDNSVAEMQTNFGDSIVLLQNTDNLGGSCGFNTGMREALKQDYEYIVLLDNDVILKNDALENFIRFMDENAEVGLAGAKLYSMDNPDVLQEFGADIDFENFKVKPYYKNYKDSKEIPSVVFCDYVPACAAIARVAAVKVIGLMPESNFIYWDDIEWGYLFKKAGYKVSAINYAIAWHKMGAGARQNTFAAYYFWRNRIHFFATYCNNDQLQHLCKTIITDLFDASYSCVLFNKKNAISTILNAFEDGINKRRGKAEDGIIQSVDFIPDKLKKITTNQNELQIVFNGDIYTLRLLIIKLKDIGFKGTVKLIAENKGNDGLLNQFKELELIKEVQENTFLIQLCEHIFKVPQYRENIMYVDQYMNVAYGAKDIRYCQNYESSKRFFFDMHYDYVYRKLKKISGESQ